VVLESKRNAGKVRWTLKKEKKGQETIGLRREVIREVDKRVSREIRVISGKESLEGRLKYME